MTGFHLLLSCSSSVGAMRESSKVRWQWNITMFNRRYIFKCLFFHRNVCLQECNFFFWKKNKCQVGMQSPTSLSWSKKNVSLFVIFADGLTDLGMEKFDEGIEMSSSDLARVLQDWQIPLSVQFPRPSNTPPPLDAVRHHGKTCISSTVSSHMSGRDTCPLLQTNNKWNLKLVVIFRTNCWKMFVFRFLFHMKLQGCTFYMFSQTELWSENWIMMELR